MNKELRELREKRAKLITDARAILDKADAENRALTAEEDQQYTRIMADVETMGRRIDREDQLQTLEAQMRASQGTVAAGKETNRAAPEKIAWLPEDISPEARQKLVRRFGAYASDEYRTHFARYMVTGHRSPVERYLEQQIEARTLEATDDTLGGFLQAPPQMVQGILQAVDDAVIIRGLANVIPVGGSESLGAVSLDADPDDADWTTELATGNEDTGTQFGKRELRPHPLAKRIKVSNKLLQSAVLDVEALVRQRLAYKFGVTLEKAYMTGDGVNKALGIFVASSSGITAARDVSDGNTATEVKVDGLINAKYALKAQYWPRARWTFHRDAVRNLHKEKDLDGQYLLQPNVQQGPADTLLGIPVLVSEFVPNTFTTGLYVGAIADFSFYWIVDSLQFTLQRLVELYAETNQVGLIGRYEGDGMPVLEEAFVRVKLA